MLFQLKAESIQGMSLKNIHRVHAHIVSWLPTLLTIQLTINYIGTGEGSVVQDNPPM